MTTELPLAAKPFKRTPSFTKATIPAGLLRDHSTKEGTWGLVRVEEDLLRYIVSDPRRPHRVSILSAKSATGIVQPTIIDFVEPVGAVRFHVEFFREK